MPFSSWMMQHAEYILRLSSQVQKVNILPTEKKTWPQEIVVIETHDLLDPVPFLRRLHAPGRNCFIITPDGFHLLTNDQLLANTGSTPTYSTHFSTQISADSANFSHFLHDIYEEQNITKKSPSLNKIAAPTKKSSSQDCIQVSSSSCGRILLIRTAITKAIYITMIILPFLYLSSSFPTCYHLLKKIEPSFKSLLFKWKQL